MEITTNIMQFISESNSTTTTYIIKAFNASLTPQRYIKTGSFIAYLSNENNGHHPRKTTDFSGHHSDFEAHVHRGVLYWLCVAGMSIMIVGLIWINILLIPKIRTYLSNENNGHHPRKTVILSAVTIVILTLSALFSFVSTIMILIYSDFKHQLIVDDILTKFSFCLYCGSQTLMIYVFTMRIDGVFSNTSISYPRYVITSLYISCFVFALFYIFFMICLIFELWSICYIIAVIWIIMYFCLSLMLCVLFVRKIESLMVKSSKIDKDMLYVILKSVVLIPLSISCSFILFMLMVIIISVLTPGQWNPFGIFWNVLDCSVSSLCLFLLFASNNEYYNKYCECIHDCCEQRTISRMERKRIPSTDNKTETSHTQHTRSDGTSGSTLERVTSSSVAQPRSYPQDIIVSDINNASNLNDIQIVH